MPPTDRPRVRRWAPVTVLAPVVVALTTVVATPAQATPPRLPGLPPPVPPSDRFAAAPIEWGECDPATFYTDAATGASLIPAGYRCADYRVPLDYDRPDGEQITLALIKRPAGAPPTEAEPEPPATADPQGTIFVNPGGPGGSGVDTVAGDGDGLFGPEVLTRFDIVGFDPRGTNRSTGLQCYPDSDAGLADAATDELRVAWPETPEEFAAARRDALDFAADCRGTAGRIIRHMGTTNVARDVDVLRRAVGDPQLNFIGYSYGTYLCAQYVAQFADRVGAVACDANIDPVEYAVGEPPLRGPRVPNFARQGTEAGSDATFAEFLRLCEEAGPQRCAFAPGAAARFDALYDALAATPLDLGAVPVLDERGLVRQVLGYLYGPLAGFPVLAQVLAELELRVAGAAPPAPPVEEEPGFVPPAEPVYFGVEQLDGVSCTDNLQPRGLAPWRRAIERADGLFGRHWASGDLTCAYWPAYDTDTVLGPFDRPTPNPVLVVNSRFDAATPWEDAVDHERRYPNAAFLDVVGWGHGGQQLSQCSSDIVDGYFLTRTVPADRMTCTQDVAPFSPAPAGPAPAEDATIPDEVVEEAADAALAALAAGDVAGAVDAFGAAVVAGLEQAGRTDLADTVRAQEAVLREARTGLTLLR